ncbi:MAG: nitrophenyl compound nitroreductase subunit ArsF family protein [Bacteroidales bacterium]|nr:nitrophenyl compound nitroreductase subunit ArsF family protein [Bacteroidales bacterium]
MKNLVLLIFSLLVLVSCGDKDSKKSEKENMEITQEQNSGVNVYYFHGNQRCKTCIAVQDLTKATIEKTYPNTEVRFIEVNTSKKENEALVEKYEVSWNALIIEKGENSEDLTEQAFALAVNSPKELEKIIIETVDRYKN